MILTTLVDWCCLNSEYHVNNHGPWHNYSYYVSCSKLSNRFKTRMWVWKGCGIVLGILFFFRMFFFFWLGAVLGLSRLLFGKTQGWKAGSCGFSGHLGVVLGPSRLRSGETSGEMQVPSRFGHKKLLQKANCPVHFCFLCVYIYVDVCVCVCDRVCSMCFLSVVVLIFHSMHFFSCICNLSI